MLQSYRLCVWSKYKTWRKYSQKETINSFMEQHAESWSKRAYTKTHTMAKREFIDIHLRERWVSSQREDRTYNSGREVLTFSLIVRLRLESHQGRQETALSGWAINFTTSVVFREATICVSCCGSPGVGCGWSGLFTEVWGFSFYVWPFISAFISALKPLLPGLSPSRHPCVEAPILKALWWQWWQQRFGSEHQAGARVRLTG